MRIDYKKSYDSVPHSWLYKILELYKISDGICTCIKYLIPFWRTRIYLPYDKGCVTTQENTFNCVIFQVESLYPLLLCLAWAPLTHMLKRAGVGYRIHNKTVSHLLYVYDLKVFARNPKEIKKLNRLLKCLANTYVWNLVLTNTQWSTRKVVLFLTHLVSQKPPSYQERMTTSI